MTNKLWHPPAHTPILTWWDGIYSRVFIALHPFYRIRTAEGTDLGPTYEHLFDYEDRPDKIDDMIKSRGEAVSWSEVHRAVAPQERQDRVHLAIWLSSVGVFAERANISLQEAIIAFCEEEKLYCPEEQGLPAILENSVGEFLKEYGKPTVTAWSQFLEHSTEIPISAFRLDQPSVFVPDGEVKRLVWALHLPDPGLLLSWDFESTEILIAMTDEAHRIAKPETLFEGWYATDKTYSDVHNPPEFLKRKS